MTWAIREHVRFRDCDAMGHVNNAVFSTYLEQARIAILGGLETFILARVEIDFRAELHSGEEIEVRSRCRGSEQRASTSTPDLGRRPAGRRCEERARRLRLCGGGEYAADRRPATEIGERMSVYERHTLSNGLRV